MSIPVVLRLPFLACWGEVLFIPPPLCCHTLDSEGQHLRQLAVWAAFFFITCPYIDAKQADAKLVCLQDVSYIFCLSVCLLTLHAREED